MTATTTANTLTTLSRLPTSSTTTTAGASTSLTSTSLAAATTLGANGKIVIVTTTAQLEAAVKVATAGEVIELAPGTYNSVNLYGDKPAGNITIESESNSSKAVITDIGLGLAGNMSFNNITFSTAGHAFTAGDQEYTYGVRLSGASNISFNSDSFIGSATGGWNNDISGVQVLNSTNVSISNSNFQYLHDALDLGGSNGISVSNNTFQDITDDGIDSGGDSNVLITGNSFTNMYGDNVGQHSDAIQFCETNSGVSSNITITNNTMVRGPDGSGDLQGIFMQDVDASLGGGSTVYYPYQNVTITGNNISGYGFNSIYVIGADNSNISDNTAVGYSDQAAYIRVQNGVNDQFNANIASIVSSSGMTNSTQVNDYRDPQTAVPATLTQAMATLSTLAAFDRTISQTVATPVDHVVLSSTGVPSLAVGIK